MRYGILLLLSTMFFSSASMAGVYVNELPKKCPRGAVAIYNCKCSDGGWIRNKVVSVRCKATRNKVSAALNAKCDGPSTHSACFFQSVGRR